MQRRSIDRRRLASGGIFDHTPAALLIKRETSSQPRITVDFRRSSRRGRQIAAGRRSAIARTVCSR
jgi:hypothetical protein